MTKSGQVLRIYLIYDFRAFSATIQFLIKYAFLVQELGFCSLLGYFSSKSSHHIDILVCMNTCH